jgi:hypothetical protein
VDYSYFGIVVEVVDHPPLVKVTFYVFYNHVYTKKKNGHIHRKNPFAFGHMQQKG